MSTSPSPLTAAALIILLGYWNVKRKIFWVVGIALLGLLWPSLAAAQSDASAWSVQASYEFGQTMLFQLTAENPDPIEQVTLFVSTPEFPSAYSVTKNVAPARQIAVSQEMDLAQVRLAPFTTVTYWWVLETAVGDIILPEKTIIYEDDQFEWRQLENDEIVVHWTGDDSALGQLALDTIDASLDRLSGWFPPDDNPPDDKLILNLYLYPSSADLRAALRLTGRDWVGAHAHPDLGVILVTAVNVRTAATDLQQSIPHELVHFLLYQAAGSNYDNVPLWFNEGLASFVETVPNPSYEALMATAVANQTTIPFADLCQTFPSVAERALLAYAQSESLISYIQSRYGERALANMITVYADGADCVSGVSRVLSHSLDDLNRDWLHQQQPRSPLAQFWLDNSLWLLLLLGGFGVIGLLILIPNKQL